MCTRYPIFLVILVEEHKFYGNYQLYICIKNEQLATLVRITDSLS